MLTLTKLRYLLLGNEAIAFGALSSGVYVAAGYPGTPSSDIIETLMKYGKDRYVEWSTNEKVAFETALGAAMMGARAMATMKHVGVNVIADALMSSSYSGVEGALVIVSADDPSMWSSQSEQDNRYYGLMALIPVLEPYDPQSAYDLTIKAFELSDSIKHPVMLRTTTRISHSRGPVELLPPKEPVNGKLIKNPQKYVLVPENARRNRVEQLKRWERIQEEVEKLNAVEEGDDKVVILASGLAYAYVKEIIEDMNLNPTVVRISTPVPIPKKTILNVVSNANKVLIVEELEPVVEMQVKELLYDNNIHVELHGKDYVSRIGELTLERVRSAVGKLYDIPITEPQVISVNPSPRPPALCAGCPHRSSFIDLKRGLALASLSNTFFSGDIGCYTLGVLPPFNEQDSALEMGSSLGVINGVYRATGQIPVAIIGDSTFFHAGLPALANAVYHNLPAIILVLDNRSTAMTGQQPSPSKEIDIAKVAEGLGVEFVKTFDPFDMKNAIKIISEAANWVKQNKKPAVIIAKRACAIDVLETLKGKELPVAEVDENKCTGCSICYDYFTCPAIIPLNNKKAKIDPLQCIGCGACVSVCPYNAISIKGKPPEGWEEAWLS
ncbi:MAG: indolepyruvate ferredoxin oxidoreductase subunit alpha [Sulfolobaceae archaeon]|nr:indolepyruvate ferredoxin oxidoreductase subunit alpha [Sulfolobaceae archaeon]